ncbi:glycosyltransferase [Candidatus Sumerlaeota bacterium]|nr:glycosyltransferase [Candidatus Sumerlaeota bacterium]
MNLPTISLVIPVFRRPREIRRCLQGVKALNYPADRLEVLVVDNASGDETPDAVRAEGLAPLTEKKPGAAAARNCGIRAAKHEIVVFTDSDCVPAPNWLRELVRPFADPQVGGVGGRIIGASPENIYEEYNERERILDQEEFLIRQGQFFLPIIITANAAYRREVLLETGGFDEWFNVNAEDADLAWRVQWAGHELRYAPEAAVIHHHRASLQGMARAFYSYGAGTVFLLKRHGGKLGLRSQVTWPMYRMWLTSPLKLPYTLVAGQSEYERWKPWLDWVHASAHLAAKWRYSLKLGVVCL